ncbi:D-alanyl-D-alanine carboxypeptidase/D-alanyl-D-alanine endopeptidase [Streptacidiphilus sp. PAMC 29251]
MTARVALLATLLTLVPAAVSATGGTRASAAGGPTAADRTVAARLQVRFAGAGLGAGAVGQVVDVASGRTVWASGAGTGRMPASTNKLAVAVAALTALGPDRTEQTSTRYAAATGTLYLVGGGDQRLTSADLGALAAATAKALIRQQLPVTALRVDDSLFPAPTAATASPGWLPGYYPSELAPVRALALCGARVNDTALAAGKLFAGQLAQQLTASGVRLTASGVRLTASGVRLTASGVRLTAGQPTRAAAPATAVELAAHTSKPLWEAVEYMLKVSDNNIAEGLLRLTALARHRPPTWQDGTAAVREILTGYRIPLRGVAMFDGSGLSRRDRMTAAALSALAALAVDPRAGKQLWPLFPGLPIAGQDGTLAARLHRFSIGPSRCAAGLVHAKTGTLHDTVALAGVARGHDGRWKAFAFVENGPVPLSRARDGVDRLAATVTGCW